MEASLVKSSTMRLSLRVSHIVFELALLVAVEIIDPLYLTLTYDLVQFFVGRNCVFSAFKFYQSLLV